MDACAVSITLVSGSAAVRDFIPKLQRRRDRRGVRYLHKFLKLLQKLVYLNYIRGCLQFSVILNTQCVSVSAAAL